MGALTVPLIAIEGIDGAGKTTVAGALAHADPSLLITGEMRSPLGPTLRSLLPILTPIEKVYWFAADRASSLAAADRRMRETAAHAVIWDRYIDSARVYRRAEVELGIAAPAVLELVEQVNAAFPPPDLVLYLDLDLETARDRLSHRHLPADPRQPIALSDYRRRAEEDASYVMINAGRPEQTVLADALAAVTQLLP